MAENNNHIQLALDTTSPSQPTSVTYTGTVKNIASGLSFTITNKDSTALYYRLWIVGQSTAEQGYTYPANGSTEWKAMPTGNVLTLPATPADTEEIWGESLVNIQFMDGVGNITTVDASKIQGTFPTGITTRGTNSLIIDAEAPIGVTATFEPGATTVTTLENATATLTNYMKVAATESTQSHEGEYGPAGIYKVTISGSQLTADATKTFDRATSITADTCRIQFSFKAGTTLGDYPVTVKVEDACGNSTTVTKTIHVDTSADNVVARLYSEGYSPETAPIASASTADAAPWINDPIICLNVNITPDHGTSHDFVSYKFWTDTAGHPGTEPTSWTDLTATQKAQNSFDLGGDIHPGTIIADKSASKGDAICIHLKMRDHVGNAKTFALYIKYWASTDVYPTTLTWNDGTTTTKVVSDQTGFSSQTIKYNAEVSQGDWADHPTYNLVMTNKTTGTTIVSKTSEKDATFASTTAVSGTNLTEGENTIEYVLTDEAGNTTKKTLTVIYDTTKPTVTISSPSNQWYKAHPTVTCTLQGQTHESSLTVTAWTSNSASTGGTVPTGAVTTTKPLTAGKSENLTLNDSDIGWNLTQGTGNYLHIKVTDAVGNSSETVQQFKFDNVAPAAPTVEFSVAGKVYGSVNGTLTLTHTGKDTSGATDSSGIAKMVFANGGSTTDFTTIASVALGTPVAWATSANFTFTATDGEKKVKVKVIDNAGNESAWSTVDTAELDRSAPIIAAASLYQTDHTTVKPNIDNVYTFGVKYSVSDDTVGSQVLTYTLSGDTVDGKDVTGTVTLSSGSATNQWIDAECSHTNGIKNFSLVFKDAAGNTSDATALSFTIEVTVPEVYVTVDGNFNTISKVDSYRLSSNGSTVTTTTYKCNQIVAESHIGGTASTPSTEEKDKAVEWKAHAYKTQAEAAAGNHNDGKVIEGTSGTNAAGVFQTTITITGASYEKALNGGTVPAAHAMDGIHYVVIYMKNRSNNWSESASFAA